MPPTNYLSVKRSILAGDVKNLSDLLGLLSKTTLAYDMKTTPKRFNRMIANPALFTLGDISNIAQVIDVDFKLVLDIVQEDFISKQTKKRR